MFTRRQPSNFFGLNIGQFKAERIKQISKTLFGVFCHQMYGLKTLKEVNHNDFIVE